MSCLVCLCVVVVANDALGQHDAPTLARYAIDGHHNRVAQIINACPADPDKAFKLRDALIDGYLTELRGDRERWERGAGWVIALHNKTVTAPQNLVDWRRSMWQTDLAQQLLFRAMPQRHMAGDFILLGCPSPGQRSAADLLTTRLWGYLDEAEAEHQRVRNTLSKRPDYQTEYVETGRVNRMRDHLTVHVPYYRAWTALLLSTQADDGPYFKKYRDAETRRAALLRRAAMDAAAVAKNQKGFDTEARARLHLLTAMIAVARGDQDTARRQLAAADNAEGVSDYTRMQVRLARAQSLTASGRYTAAAAVLDSLDRQLFVRSSPFHMVLVADQRFAMLCRRALAQQDPAQQDSLLAEAFDVYEKLLVRSAMKPWREPFEQFVRQRYTSQIPKGVTHDQLPPIVRLALIKDAYRRAMALDETGDASESKPLYESAVEMSRDLLAETRLSEEDHAEAGYMLGLSLLQLGRLDEAGPTLLDVAERYPKLQRGEQAMVVVYLRIARPAFRDNPDDQATSRFYEQTLRLMLTSYPLIEQSSAARYELPVYLHHQRRYAEAYKAYGRVPDEHPAFAESIYEKMKCAHAIWVDARSVKTARDTITASEEYLTEAQRVMATGRAKPQRVERLTRYSVGALLTRAGVVLQQFDAIDQAERAVDQVAQVVGDNSEWQSRILSLRITIAEKRGDYAAAAKAVDALHRLDPELGGGMAASLLRTLDDHAKRRAENRAGLQELSSLADAACALADRAALPWANKQASLPTTQKMLLAQVPADCLYRAARYDRALQRYEAIEKQFPTIAGRSLSIIESAAECRYHLKQYEPARAGYEKIIRNAQTQQRYDRHYWLAQLRCYQMWDARLAGSTDPRLGRSIDVLLEISGQRGLTDDFRSRLVVLRDKHLSASSRAVP